jgi:DNA primase
MADEIIVVEGRADVLNMLKCGIKNVIAMDGARVPPAIADLSKEKVVTLFVDGDRTGRLIIRELIESADVDYIAIAPQGKEVEELSKKEIFKCLKDRVSTEQYKAQLKE